MDKLDSTQIAKIRVLQFVTISFIASVIALVFVAKRAGLSVEMYAEKGIAELIPFVGVATFLIPISQFSQRAILRRRLSELGSNLSFESVYKAYAAGLFIGHALRETITIIAFVVSMMCADPSWVTGFGVVSITLFSLNWPTLEKVEALWRAI